mmetsp:Transcript_121450/g.189609  ORF Transcript_121450/g.189609 Transcript_121450/m.189609 type:complete len:107 (-) Transcript_121450:124-444(-)
MKRPGLSITSSRASTGAGVSLNVDPNGSLFQDSVDELVLMRKAILAYYPSSHRHGLLNIAVFLFCISPELYRMILLIFRLLRMRIFQSHLVWTQRFEQQKYHCTCC